MSESCHEHAQLRDHGAAAPEPAPTAPQEQQPSPDAVGRAQRSEPERSDGERSGARPTSYDSDGNVTASVDALGNTAYTDYDADGRVTAVVNANGNTSLTDYDADGNVTATVDALGNTSFADYDADGRMTAAVDANGNTSFTEYDADGRATATIDRDGYTSLTSYDAAGNATQTVDADAHTTEMSYDADNRLTQSIDNNGATATYAYDGDGNVTQSVDVYGFTTQQFYNGDDNVTETIGQNGATSFQEYDADGRVTEAIDGNGNTTQASYDADGNVTKSIDGRGDTTLQKYDADGRMTAAIDGNGATTLYKYDGDGNQTAVIDPDLNTTVFSFDGDDRMTKQVDPNGGTATYAYDGDGNQTEVISANGSSIVSVYDADDRMTQQVWYSDSGVVNDTTNKTYDDDGNLLTNGNSAGTYTFAYDPDSRLTNVQEPFGVSLTYAYDGVGNQTQVVDSFGGTQTSYYDLDNRLTSRTYTGEGQDLRIDFTYGANSQIATETRSSDLVGTDLVAETTYSYDGDGNVTTILTTNSSSATIDKFQYAYDRAGNVSSETYTQGGTATTTSYTYDADNELTAAGAASYSYDANGNRSSGTTIGTDNELMSDGTYDYTYDDKGNEVSKTNIATGDEWIYHYNNANQLVEAVESTSGSVLEKDILYTYDAFGNLIEEQAYTAGSGWVTTKYAVDGWNTNMAAPTGLENFNDWAVLNSGNTLQTRNIFGNQVDQILARVDQTGASDPSGTYWDLTDHLGSVRDVINNSGTVEDSIQYDAYGNLNTATETNSAYRGMYAWTGRQLDVETGLQYNRARWYDANTGRWISQDPLGFDAGDNNLYSYAHDNPLTGFDPSGDKVEVVFFEGFFGVGFNFPLPNGKTQKIQGSPILKDNYYNPYLNKYPHVNFKYFSQDQISAAEKWIRDDPYTFAIHGKQFVKQKNRFVLIGYSAGGDSVSRVAQDLVNSRNFDLAFTIDPVLAIRNPFNNAFLGINAINGFQPVPNNVSRWVNFFQNTDMFTLKGYQLSLLFHGVCGFQIPGASYERQVVQNDYPGNQKEKLNAAEHGHVALPLLSFIKNMWQADLGKENGLAANDPWVRA